MAHVYLSSTYEDLKGEREAVYRALRRIRHDVVAMEDYVATDRRPLDKCLADVRRCDIYVGIIGWRYGFIPPGKKKSITELEFREAVKTGKTCLLFLKDDASRPARLRRGRGDRIAKLREQIRRKYLISFFGSPDDLAAKATAAVANIFGELWEAVGELDMPLSQVVNAVKQLSQMPPLSIGQIEAEVQHLQADAMNWVTRYGGLISAQRRLSDARRLIAEGIRQEPKNADLLTLLGYVEKTQWQISTQTGEVEGARESLLLAARYFRAALKIEASNVGALNGQVNVFLAGEDYEQAVALGRLVTMIHPGYTAAFWDLGIALSGKLKQDGPTEPLVKELADVYEALERLIPGEPSGFTPADLAYAQREARRFRGLATEFARKRPAGRSPVRRRIRPK